MQKIFKNLFLVTILAIFIIIPSISFAQTSSGVDVQIVPSYGYGGSTVGSSSYVVPTSDIQDPNAPQTGNLANPTSGEEQALGGGLPVIDTSPATGPLVGVSADYSQGPRISSGLSCRLADRPNLKDLILFATCLLSRAVVPLLLGFAMVIFIWGVVQYVIATDDETKKKKGKMFMIWGIIALAVMISVWGLTKILSDTFGTNEGWVIPQLNTGKNNNSNNNTAPIQTDPTIQGGSFIDVINTDQGDFNLPSA